MKQELRCQLLTVFSFKFVEK